MFGPDDRPGQSIFEYFILTIIVVSVALFFMKNKAFQKIQDSTNTSFNQAVEKITANEADAGGSSGGSGGPGGSGAGGR
ncbi:MAG: hypothetical protein PHH68_08580 [Candidatus Omnitrophica bacterium]|jgi:fatty acid/phospholipid biosynthesis enzyme|nr:hypothetical protein [Candidatus Omnitrophota bacterium]